MWRSYPRQAGVSIVSSHLVPGSGGWTCSPSALRSDANYPDLLSWRHEHPAVAEVAPASRGSQDSHGPDPTGRTHEGKAGPGRDRTPVHVRDPSCIQTTRERERDEKESRIGS